MEKCYLISNTPNITVPVTASEIAGPIPSSDLYELGDWVIVRYLFYIICRVNLLYFFSEITDCLLKILEGI